MTVIGVSFDLQQDEDFRLMSVLENVIDPTWYWRFGGGENYIRNSASDPWDMTELLTNWDCYSGKEFLQVIDTPRQYIIFADLKAFPSKENVKKLIATKNLSRVRVSLR